MLIFPLYRWRVFEAAHNLHHVTWMCAVRRANVFSQSLGLAVTSYLAAIADPTRNVAGWPEIWKSHGYMVCFEGLLSAAGKELGMIEDARYVLWKRENPMQESIPLVDGEICHSKRSFLFILFFR